MQQYLMPCQTVQIISFYAFLTDEPDSDEESLEAAFAGVSMEIVVCDDLPALLSNRF